MVFSKKLKELQVWCNEESWMTDDIATAFIEAVLEHCPLLKSLDLMGSSRNLSIELKKRLKDMKHLEVEF